MTNGIGNPLNFASVENPGIIFTSVNPPDPEHPIAVETTDPRMPQDIGMGVLSVGMTTTVLSTRVTVNSPILPQPMDDGITGRLRAFNRVAGVSFDVVSDNGADAGNFIWFLW